LEKRHFFLFKRPLRAQQKRRDRCRLVCFVGHGGNGAIHPHDAERP
jgi:hypothetical protein